MTLIIRTAQSAVLSLGGAELRVAIVEPATGGAVINSQTVDLEPPQNPTPGVSKLEVTVPLQQVGSGDGPGVGAAAAPFVAPPRLVMSLSLNDASVETPPTMNALAMWETQGPFAA